MTQSIYFARCVGTEGPIKIGCSTDPERRVLTLSTWAPFPIEVIATIPGNYILERRVHAHFADLHSHREWFRADQRIFDAIARLKAGESLEAVIDMSAAGTIRAVGSVKRRPRTEGQRRYQSLMMKRCWAEKRALKGTGRTDLRTPRDVWDIIRKSEHEPITAGEEKRLAEFFADPLTHCVPVSVLYPLRPPPVAPTSCAEAQPIARAA